MSEEIILVDKSSITIVTTSVYPEDFFPNDVKEGSPQTTIHEEEGGGGRGRGGRGRGRREEEEEEQIRR